MTQIQFELVSPEQKIMSEAVTMAVIPGTEGGFGVLNGHAPIIATVRTGVVEIYRDNMNDKSDSIFIAGGFADVTGENCTILAEQAVNVNDIDADDIAQKLMDTESDLGLAEGTSDKRRFQKRLDVLKAMIEAVVS
jgi:F-type H+-transporting ATPase subunit epsilon